MCFECDSWFNDPAEPQELLRCDPLMFRNAPIKAGFCPFCLGNANLPPAKRMNQFIIDRAKWHSHVEAHLAKVKEYDYYHCDHPACSKKFENFHDLVLHLVDTHCYQPPRGHKRSWIESNRE
ncbi:hypothetical protein N7510_011570 [Penicillium lagena]|uniref:uncharacterized protein n=1 Tax=Penicillium lagena TaxID=94218 RepID=UPI002540CA56|nr:uncharacterized protein N7510_011570 [Penicillium lagena]KAJ5602036.1 hypothetical protein N7510_011570 [Penicillium lagena]